MNKFFKLLIVSVLAISMCLPTAAFAADELNLCGTYASIKEEGSLIAYPDGSFQRDASGYVTDTVCSGFCSISKSGSAGNEKVSLEGSNVITYPMGVGGKASTDRSVKITSLSSAPASLSAGEITEAGAFVSKIKTLDSTDSVVLDFDIYAEEYADRTVELRFGNTSRYGVVLNFNEDSTISISYAKPGTTSRTEEVIPNANYELGKWNRVKIVRDLTRVSVEGVTTNKDYVFLNGAEIWEANVISTDVTYSYITFKQAKGGSSMYIDDVEAYVATDLASALDNSKAVITPLSSEACVVDETNCTITYTTGNEEPTLSELKSDVQGNVSGVLRDGALITEGIIQTGDTVVVLSTDGRTYRYYTLTINVVIVNVLEGAEIIANSWEWEGYTVDPANMFDGKDDTYYTPKYAASDNGEIVLDLGRVKTFSQISVLNNTDNRGRYIRFTVSVSNDNAAFTEVVKNAVIQNEKGQDQIINFKETSARYVKLNLNIHNEDESTKMYLSEIKLFKKARPENICENVAINSASTNSNNTTSSVGYYAWIDGNADTMFMTNNITNGIATYILDLGQRKNFDKLYLKMGGNSYYLTSCDVKVSVSDNNKTYTTVKEYTSLAYNTEKDETLGTAMSGRYIKLEFTNIAHTSRTPRLNIKEFGLYYGGNETDPIDTAYTCLITKNSEGTKYDAAVSASAAMGEGFSGVIIGAVYDVNGNMLNVEFLDYNFDVEEGSTVNENYELTYVAGTKYAKVFLWRSLTDLVPLYANNQYTE